MIPTRPKDSLTQEAPYRSPLTCVMPYRSGVHQGLNFLFETRDWDGTPSINEPDLFDAAQWAEFTRLPEPCPDWLPGVLEMRVAGDWYREFEWD